MQLAITFMAVVGGLAFSIAVALVARSNPWGITYNAAYGGWYYIGDVGHARIVRWDPGTGTCQVVVDQIEYLSPPPRPSEAAAAQGGKR